MKKILLSLTIGLLILVGCGSGSNDANNVVDAKPTEQQITQLQDAFKELSGELNAIDVLMEIAGEVDEEKMDGKIHLAFSKDKQLEKSEVLTEIELKADGEEILMSTYVKDGKMYVDAFGMKMGTDAEAEVLEEMIGDLTTGMDFGNFDDITVEDDIKVTVEGSKLTFKVEGIGIDSFDATDLVGIDIDSLKDAEYSSEIVIVDSQLAEMNISFTSEGQNMNISMKFNGINDKVNIEFPSFEDFVTL